jgi:putative tryptophan/tyrosine transport system substrate-binding protein
LLHELVPSASVVALLENPSNPNLESRAVRDAARSLGLHLDVLNASMEADIEAAFVTTGFINAEASMGGSGWHYSRR